MRSARAFAVGLWRRGFWRSVASAQIPSPTGNLYGTALDTQGNSLPGVTVTLTGPGAAQTRTTDAKGDFHFLGLSPGDYSVDARAGGFRDGRVGT